MVPHRGRRRIERCAWPPARWLRTYHRGRSAAAGEGVVVIEHGGDEPGGLNEAGIFVARQIERDAVIAGKGRQPLHRDPPEGGRIRRFLRRALRRRRAYECTCPRRPYAGERHRLDCELRNL
jgi:hypothetical protein